MNKPQLKTKVLLLENINKTAVEIFKKYGYEVEHLTYALDEEQLKNKITDIDILGIRSKTNINKNILKRAKKLKAIGAFCIGTNQIDLETCNQNGVAVFNAPFSSTRSVVELTIGEIIMISRKIIEKNNKVHQGTWDKTANNVHEIRGKKLGIIGYGNIGSQVSMLAEILGMEVFFYDIVDKLTMGNAKKCDTKEELLKTADIVTIHVDGRPENKDLIGDNEFKLMKNNSILINLSRGFVIDIDALVKNIKNKKIAGAGIDVYPREPRKSLDKFVTKLQNLPNIILTPHIGGNTEEAQTNIGEFVTNKLIDYIQNGTTTLSVNFPQIQLTKNQNSKDRFIHIHQNIPGILAKINQILKENNINIESQFLKTNEQIGYVITDIN